MIHARLVHSNDAEITRALVADIQGIHSTGTGAGRANIAPRIAIVGGLHLITSSVLGDPSQIGTAACAHDAGRNCLLARVVGRRGTRNGIGLNGCCSSLRGTGRCHLACLAAGCGLTGCRLGIGCGPRLPQPNIRSRGSNAQGARSCA